MQECPWETESCHEEQRDVEGATGAITHGTDSVVTAVAVRTGATENPICGTCRIVGAEVWASV